MSEPFTVKIPHKLGKEEALRRIKPALGKASSSFPMLVVEEEAWWKGPKSKFRELSNYNCTIILLESRL
jgi:hypothetical protein